MHCLVLEFSISYFLTIVGLTKKAESEAEDKGNDCSHTITVLGGYFKRLDRVETLFIQGD